MRSKKNIETLSKFEGVARLFLDGKVGGGKLRMSCEKFRATCIKLDRKRREKERKERERIEKESGITDVDR